MLRLDVTWILFSANRPIIEVAAGLCVFGLLLNFKRQQTAVPEASVVETDHSPDNLILGFGQ